RIRLPPGRTVIDGGTPWADAIRGGVKEMRPEIAYVTAPSPFRLLEHVLGSGEGVRSLGADFGRHDNFQLLLAFVVRLEMRSVVVVLQGPGGQGQIVFVAMRDVAAGEDLTLDYATIEHDVEPMDCRCGAPGCRRVITGQDWRRPELQKQYGNSFAWY